MLRRCSLDLAPSLCHRCYRDTIKGNYRDYPESPIFTSSSQCGLIKGLKLESMWPVEQPLLYICTQYTECSGRTFGQRWAILLFSMLLRSVSWCENWGGLQHVPGGSMTGPRKVGGSTPGVASIGSVQLLGPWARSLTSYCSGGIVPCLVSSTVCRFG